MKKLIILFLVSFACYGQTQKGSFSVGTGTVNYSRDKMDTDESGFFPSVISTLKVNPSVGYFLINNLEAGLSLSYTSINTIYNWSNRKIIYKDYEISPLPYLIYYFGKNRFRPFVSARGGILFRKYGIIEFTPRIDHFQEGTWGFSGGVKYFITDNLTLGLNASWDKVTYEYVSNKTLYFGFNFKMYLLSQKYKKTN